MAVYSIARFSSLLQFRSSHLGDPLFAAVDRCKNMSHQYFDDLDDAILSQIDLPSTEIPQFVSGEGEHEVNLFNNACLSDEEYVSATPSPPRSPLACSGTFPHETPIGSEEIVLNTTPTIADAGASGAKKSSSFPTFISSDAVESFRGRAVVKNTERKNHSAMRLFKNFIFAEIDFQTCDFVKDLDDFFLFTSRRETHEVKVNFDEEKEMDLLRKILFPDFTGSFLAPGTKEWTDDQLRHLQFFLSEFIVRYRQKDGSEVTPGTMKGNIFGIQRFFEHEWEYSLSLTTGPIFGCPKNGLFSIIDNLFADQQSRGMTPESYNVLSSEDVEKLYSSPELSKESPRSFQTRMIYNLAISTNMRIGELHQLKRSQFKFSEQNGRGVIWVRCIVGSRIGASKNAKGGWKAVKEKPKEVPIFSKYYFGGILNPYNDIVEYWGLRNSITLKGEDDRFFVAINTRAKNKGNFFKAQPVGEHMIRKLMMAACEKNNIIGVGTKDKMEFHGLRGTGASLLIAAGMPDSSTVLRTGHKQIDSVHAYHNIRGAEGERQQDILFGGDNHPRPVKQESSENPSKVPRLEKPSSTSLPSGSEEKRAPKKGIDDEEKVRSNSESPITNPAMNPGQGSTIVPNSSVPDLSSFGINGVTINGPVTFNIIKK